MTHRPCPRKVTEFSADLRSADITIEHNAKDCGCSTTAAALDRGRSRYYCRFRRAKHTFLCYQRAIDEEFLE
jgi:hypothetical protein